MHSNMHAFSIPICMSTCVFMYLAVRFLYYFVCISMITNFLLPYAKSNSLLHFWFYVRRFRQCILVLPWVLKVSERISIFYYVFSSNFHYVEEVVEKDKFMVGGLFILCSMCSVIISQLSRLLIKCWERQVCGCTCLFVKEKLHLFSAFTVCWSSKTIYSLCFSFISKPH